MRRKCVPIFGGFGSCATRLQRKWGAPSRSYRWACRMISPLLLRKARRRCASGRPFLASARRNNVPSGSQVMLDLQIHDGVVVLLVRVQPRASKDEVAGEIAGALKIR